MADQAEILRKRREARQKKILESGESRLSKITGTSGTNQVAPSPAVIQAREELQRKEQEEERLKTMKAAVAGASAVPAIISGDTDESSEQPVKGKRLADPRCNLHRKSVPEKHKWHIPPPIFFEVANGVIFTCMTGK